MTSARYPDEDGLVCYSSEEDKALYEQIKAATGATIREISMVATALVRLDLDPIIAEGDEFTWPRPKEPDLWWISPVVPAPDANVCIMEALHRWKHDTKNCKWLLEHDDSVESSAKVLKNVIGWCRFWSVRSRSVELRGWFSEQLEDRLAGLEQLRERAFSKGQDEITELLADF
jgi:hypothetical protein